MGRRGDDFSPPPPHPPPRFRDDRGKPFSGD
jgi:hypothetical protein